jgi:hypothetical protein
MNAHEKYNFAVTFKVDCLKDHPKYLKLRAAIDRVLIERCCFGLAGISADTYTDMMLLRSLPEIESWLNGETNLKFTREEDQYNRPKLVRAAYESICAEVQSCAV